MTQPNAPVTDAMHGAHDAAHHGPNLKVYFAVFGALCVFTLTSFLFNGMATAGTISHTTSLTLISLVAVCKALLVGAFFMHLMYDWRNLYFVLIPVVIMGMMMMVVLLPDIVLGWHHDQPTDKPAAAKKAH